MEKRFLDRERIRRLGRRRRLTRKNLKPLQNQHHRGETIEKKEQEIKKQQSYGPKTHYDLSQIIKKTPKQDYQNPHDKRPYELGNKRSTRKYY